MAGAPLSAAAQPACKALALAALSAFWYACAHAECKDGRREGEREGEWRAWCLLLSKDTDLVRLAN